MDTFSGIWVPLVTPFDVSGQIDLPRLSSLVAKLTRAGVAGFVVFGTTGEPAMLDHQEKTAVLNAVLGNCSNRPVVVGASGIAPAHVIEQIALWTRLPIAGYLITPPYYVRPSQAGIVSFFAEIAAASVHPILVYDIPYRTGVQIDLNTMQALSRMDGVVGVKDCSGDAHKTQILIAEQKLQIMAGDDHMIFSTLCQGGSGAITASAHLHPELFVAMYRLLRVGQLEAARKLHHALAPLIHSLYVEPSPSILKGVLANVEAGSGALRAPMTAASGRAVEVAQSAFDKLTHIAQGLLTAKG